jgi:hypothetical protein
MHARLVLWHLAAEPEHLAQCYLLAPELPSPSFRGALSQAASSQGLTGAYPVTREVRKLSTGSRTSWLIRGRMSMRVVSERYTMIF